MNCRPRFLVYLVLALIFAGAVEGAHAAGGWCQATNTPYSEYLEWGEGCLGSAIEMGKQKWNNTYPSFVGCSVWEEGETSYFESTSTLATRVEQFVDDTGAQGCPSISGGFEAVQRVCKAGFVPNRSQSSPGCVAQPTCPAGQVYDLDAGTCHPPCAPGQTWNATSGQCLTPENPCEQGTPVRHEFAGEPGGCVNGCYVDWGVGVQGDGIVGGWYSGEQTGGQCSLPEPEGSEPIVEPEQCATNENGDSYCISGDAPENCGEVNGKFVCLDSAPKGSCQYMPGGSFICATSPNQDPPTENSPDNGDAENPVAQAPDWSMKGDDKWIHIWGPGSVDQSSAPPSTRTGTESLESEKLEGIAKESTLQSIKNDLADGLKIDETGTPEGAGDLFGDALGALDETEDSIGMGAVFDAVEMPASLPGGGSCQSITFDVFDHVVSIPGAKGCEKLEVLKDILAWAFGLSTVFYIFWLGVRRPQ